MSGKSNHVSFAESTLGERLILYLICYSFEHAAASLAVTAIRKKNLFCLALKTLLHPLLHTLVIRLPFSGFLALLLLLLLQAISSRKTGTAFKQRSKNS